MRALNKSRLELYVENYLKVHSRRLTLAEANLLRKALVWITLKLELDTCSCEEPAYDLFTLKDSQFTRTVFNMLMNMSRNMYRKSLQRTKDLLDTYLNNCCGN